MISLGSAIAKRVEKDGYFGASLFRNVDSKCVATAFAIAIFSPVTSYWYVQKSAQAATSYDQLICQIDEKMQSSQGKDFKILKCCHIMLNEMKAERVEAALSQLTMGIGVSVVLLALIIALATEGQVPQVASMLRYGLAIAGFGMATYTVSQLYFHIERKSRIDIAHNDLKLLLLQQPNTFTLMPKVITAPLVVPQTGSSSKNQSPALTPKQLSPKNEVISVEIQGNSAKVTTKDDEGQVTTNEYVVITNSNEGSPDFPSSSWEHVEIPEIGTDLAETITNA